MDPTIQFILKLLVFAVSYYFMIDYVVNCHINTSICSMIILSVILLLTLLYFISKKSI
jgi:hypothetical protein